MTVFFTILTILLVFGRVVMGYFGDSIEIIEKLLPAMNWICGISGAIAGVFIIINVCGEIKKVVSKVKYKDKDE